MRAIRLGLAVVSVSERPVYSCTMIEGAELELRNSRSSGLDCTR